MQLNNVITPTSQPRTWARRRQGVQLIANKCSTAAKCLKPSVLDLRAGRLITHFCLCFSLSARAFCQTPVTLTASQATLSGGGRATLTVQHAPAGATITWWI